MNRHLRVWTSVTVLIAFGLPGCQHYCNKLCSPAGPCVPCPPGPAPAPTPYPSGVPQAPAAPVPAAPDVRLYTPPPEPVWRAPAGGGVNSVEPPVAPPEPSRESVRLYPPQSAPPKPAVTEQRSPTPQLPVGIPQFAVVKDRIASGLKPNLDGGLDWLQSNGYRTVLHIRAPGQEDNADRREVEKRGLKYRSMEVSPQTLSRAVLDEFNRVVGDTALQALFVYDKDGMVAGGLWYLHFRTVEKGSDESARTRAARLGLKEDQNGEHRAMWLAIQKLLSEQNN
jgi:hypothetical protein